MTPTPEDRCNLVVIYRNGSRETYHHASILRKNETTAWVTFDSRILRLDGVLQCQVSPTLPPNPEAGMTSRLPYLE